jgi:hypothetical protein
MLFPVASNRDPLIVSGVTRIHQKLKRAFGGLELDRNFLRFAPRSGHSINLRAKPGAGGVEQMRPIRRPGREVARFGNAPRGPAQRRGNPNRATHQGGVGTVKQDCRRARTRGYERDLFAIGREGWLDIVGRVVAEINLGTAGNLSQEDLEVAGPVGHIGHSLAVRR